MRGEIPLFLNPHRQLSEYFGLLGLSKLSVYRIRGLYCYYDDTFGVR